MGQWVLDLVRSAGYPGIVFLMFTESDAGRARPLGRRSLERVMNFVLG
jgi:hypothetical protein